MNETLEDLAIKRKAVVGVYNDLYEDLKIETYENAIKELKAKIRTLERDLEIYRQLLNDEIEKNKNYKEQLEFMKRVKTIKIN